MYIVYYILHFLTAVNLSYRIQNLNHITYEYMTAITFHFKT